MANVYREQLTVLLTATHPELEITHALEFKNVFGAVGGYIDGTIFVSQGKFGVALRLAPEILKRLFDDGKAGPLKYFPNGHVKKEYAVLSEQVLRDTRQVAKLIEQSVAYVSSLN